MTLEFGTQDSSGPPNKHGLKSKGISGGAGEGTIPSGQCCEPHAGEQVPVCKCLAAAPLQREGKSYCPPSACTGKALLHGDPKTLGFLPPIHNFSDFGLKFRSNIDLVSCWINANSRIVSLLSLCLGLLPGEGERRWGQSHRAPSCPSFHSVSFCRVPLDFGKCLSFLQGGCEHPCDPPAPQAA